MPNPQLPECFCAGMEQSECDWKVEIIGRMYRPGHEGEAGIPESKVAWDLDNIPQFLAQVIFQGQIDAVNKKGAEVYLAWAKGCIENAGDVQAFMSQQIARVTE